MKVLLCDVETRAHEVMAWGLFQQNISINQILRPGSTICAAMKWLGDHPRKTVFTSEWEDGMEEMVKRIHDMMSEADAIITYNGDKFDVPVLHKEFVLHGLHPPKPSISIDLYKTVKRQFRFASNKLDFVCQQLGLGAKTQHKGMDLWRGVIDGNEKDRKTMKVYNIQDVALLEKLYNKLRPWIATHPSVPLHNGDTEEQACRTCGSHKLQSRGYKHTKTAIYQQFQCQECGSWMRNRLLDAVAGKRKGLMV